MWRNGDGASWRAEGLTSILFDREGGPKALAYLHLHPSRADGLSIPFLRTGQGELFKCCNICKLELACHGWQKVQASLQNRRFDKSLTVKKCRENSSMRSLVTGSMECKKQVSHEASSWWRKDRAWHYLGQFQISSKVQDLKRSFHAKAKDRSPTRAECTNMYLPWKILECTWFENGKSIGKAKAWDPVKAKSMSIPMWQTIQQVLQCARLQRSSSVRVRTRVWIHQRLLYKSCNVMGSRQSSLARAKARIREDAADPGMSPAVNFYQGLHSRGLERKLPCKIRGASPIAARSPRTHALLMASKILCCTKVQKKHQCKCQGPGPRRSECVGRTSLHQGQFHELWKTQSLKEGAATRGPRSRAFLHHRQAYKYYNVWDTREALKWGPRPQHFSIRDYSTNPTMYRTQEEAPM